MPERHYSIKTIANLYDTTERTIWRAIQKGQLRSVSISPGLRRIPESALDEWVGCHGTVADVVPLRRVSG